MKNTEFSLLAQAPPPRSLGVALAQCFAQTQPPARARWDMLWRLFHGSPHSVRQACLVELRDMHNR